MQLAALRLRQHGADIGEFRNRHHIVAQQLLARLIPACGAGKTESEQQAKKRQRTVLDARGLGLPTLIDKPQRQAQTPADDHESRENQRRQPSIEIDQIVQSSPPPFWIAPI
ncbi:MAG: hypothetical protein JO200_20720 [Comamonas sp.]|nr:hypothetical protein [Comamonas sp.]